MVILTWVLCFFNYYTFPFFLLWITHMFHLFYFFPSLVLLFLFKLTIVLYILRITLYLSYSLMIFFVCHLYNTLKISLVYIYMICIILKWSRLIFLLLFLLVPFKKYLSILSIYRLCRTIPYTFSTLYFSYIVTWLIKLTALCVWI